MGEQKQRNHYLGFAEGIMTCLVVMIHCRFPGKAGEILATLFFVAVPFFFSVSGFFYYNADVRISLSRTKRKILHLFPMLICGELFYYLWYVFLQVRKYGFSHRVFAKVIKNEVAVYELSNILVPRPLFNSVLWFVIQLILVYMIIHWMLCKERIKMAKGVVPILLLLGAIISLVAYKLFGFYPAYNIPTFPLFMGFPYFLGGYYIRENSERLRSVSLPFISIMALVGVGLVFVQRTLFSYIGSYFGHAFILLAVWLWILRKTGKTSKTILYLDTFGEKYSMYVYLFHVWVYGLMDVILESLLPLLTQTAVWGWIRPFAACVTSAVFAVILQKILQSFGMIKGRLQGNKF